MTHTYLNGKLVLNARALLPVADRGFRFGDGVFETIAVHDGVPYQWEMHEGRLFDGLHALKINIDEVDFRDAVSRLMARNALRDGFVRIAISRGSGSRGYRPVADIQPSIVIETSLRQTTPKEPMNLWFSRYSKPPRTSLPVNLKTAQGLGSTLAIIEAQEHGCAEALMLSHDGLLCEAASANLFWFKDDVLYTPTAETGCLKGTTRDAIIRLSPYRVKHCSLHLDALEDAQTVFITNCNLGVCPVASLLPQGWVWWAHDVAESLDALYRDDIQRYIKAHKGEWQ